MKDDEIRIAIAEKCGWQDVVQGVDSLPPVGLPPGFTEDQCPEGADEVLPDYLNDLNAMREVENWLRDNDNMRWVKYGDALDGRFGFSAKFASASQRAEAFLRVFGLWREVDTGSSKK